MKYQQSYIEAINTVELFVNNQLPRSPGWDQKVRIAIENVAGRGEPEKGKLRLAYYALSFIQKKEPNDE